MKKTQREAEIKVVHAQSAIRLSSLLNYSPDNVPEWLIKQAIEKRTKKSTDAVLIESLWYRGVSLFFFFFLTIKTQRVPE